MVPSYEAWQLTQLVRLATLEPARCGRAMQTLFHHDPGLFTELVVMALDQDQISRERAAELLGLSIPETEARLEAFRDRDLSPDRVVVADSINGQARLRDSRVYVWEIVREYRKLGSVQRLEDSFPVLTKAEIAAALKYAQAHPEAIETQIRRFEEVASRRQQFERLGSA